MTPSKHPVSALAALLLATLLAAPALAAEPPRASTPEFLAAEPGRVWRFPEDHWAARGYRNEWWYFTGNVEAVDDSSRRFGFQLTFFRVGFVPGAPPLASAWASPGAVMAHAAITDVAAGAHSFSEVLWREMPLLAGFGAHPDPLVAWALPPPGSSERWTLRFTGPGFALAMQDPARGMALDLSVAPAKPLVFQGPAGYSRKSGTPGYASLYYSFTRMSADGTITADGRRWRVRGSAWMDREMGSSQLAPGQVGWDWWSLQLADGRELMLYQLRRAGGAVDYAYATVVAADGATRWLEPGAWKVRATRTWRSPETGAEYPAAWSIAIPSESIDVRVEPLVAAQENVAHLAGGLFYWEGAVRVVSAAGTEAGRGFVELTGYGDRNRPPL